MGWPHLIKARWKSEYRGWRMIIRLRWRKWPKCPYLLLSKWADSPRRPIHQSGKYEPPVSMSPSRRHRRPCAAAVVPSQSARLLAQALAGGRPPLRCSLQASPTPARVGLGRPPLLHRRLGARVLVAAHGSAAARHEARQDPIVHLRRGHRSSTRRKMLAWSIRLWLPLIRPIAACLTAQMLWASLTRVHLHNWKSFARWKDD